MNDTTKAVEIDLSVWNPTKRVIATVAAPVNPDDAVDTAQTIMRETIAQLDELAQLDGESLDGTVTVRADTLAVLSLNLRTVAGLYAAAGAIV